jgi:translocation and assembly module TamA
MTLGVRGASLVLAAALLGSVRVFGADPQPYKVEFVSTDNGAIDDTLKATSQLQTLRTSAPVNPFGLIARARGDLSRLKTALESFGYYQSSVAITVDGSALDDPALGDTLTALAKDTDAHCKITPTLGPLYHLGRIDIDGEIPQSARATLRLSPGAPAVASEVLAGGARLLTALQNQGYAFAKVDPPIAYEDPDRRVLDLNFHVVAGPAVRIGEIRFEGLRGVHESRVRERLLLHTGEQYSALKVEQARKDLLALGVFGAVTVSLAEALDAEGRVPVTFRVRERRRRAVTLSAAYSSDLGGSFGVTWADRNLSGKADQLNLAASAINLGGSATNGVGYDTSAKYLLTDFRRRDQSLQFSVGALRQFLDAYDQTAQTAGITLIRKLSSVWTASLGVSVAVQTIIQPPHDIKDSQGNILVAETTYDYTLFALPIGVLYDSTNLLSPLDDPTHGMRGSINIAPTWAQGHPTAEFLIIQGSLAYYLDLEGLLRTAPGRSVLALRGIAGLASGASQYSLPPDQRFYAGGSGTVRGYRYQSVGPQFPDGTPIGGTAMSAGSVEFRQRIGMNLGMAVFADAGHVTNSLDPFSGEFRIGAGAGVRYYTPIGALRFDLAVPVGRQPGDDRFEIYIGIGQAF